MVMWFIIIALGLFFLIPFVAGLLGIKMFDNKTDDASDDELKELNKQERLEIMANTIGKYNRLYDTLVKQYEIETDEKKKAIILSKQIATLEKLNRALEKREKLE